MDIHNVGTFRRTQEHEAEDVQQAARNMRNESWKSWPNEAAFDHLEEHRGPISLHVKGDIPAWAAGSLYRTGPGQSRVDGTPRGTHYTTHWFDGFAQMHRFDIGAPETPGAKTTVTYSSRRQSEDFVAHVRKTGWRSGFSFGQKADPCMGIFSKFMTVFAPGFANNNVVPFPNMPGLADKSATPKSQDHHHPGDVDNMYITTDYAGLRQVDPETLEPIGVAMQKSLHPSLTGVASCAHAQRDPDSGDVFNFNLDLVGRTPTYRVFRVDAATGETEILATVAESGLPAAYIHSFFLTASFVVLCVPSSRFGWNGMKIPWERNYLDAIEPFDRSKECRWIVVDRRHGKGVVARFSTPAAFFFHTVNAFEERSKREDGTEETHVCMDAIVYDNLDILAGFYYDVILDRNEATRKFWLGTDGGGEQRIKELQLRLARHRFTIPAGDGEANDYSARGKETLSILGPHAGELPTINPRFAGKPYRYVYSTPSRGLSTVVDALAKTDLETRETLMWTGPAGHTPGEAVFVERPPGVGGGGTGAEDDGVLLSVVVDGAAERAYLLCLDARTMEELGRAEADFAIGMGFHGVHVP